MKSPGCRNTMKQFISLFLLLLVATQGAATKGTAISSSSFSVEDVHLTSSKTGEDNHLQFRIRNDSRERLVLLSVKSAYFSSARILARVGASEWEEVGSIAIPADSTLDLRSSHLRIVIERLDSELPADASVPVQFQFRRGSVTVAAHVMEP